MSGITVHVYDGDAEHYLDEDETGTIGARVNGEERYFGDDEELEAVQDIIALLSEGKHFDVRQWRN